MPTENITDEVSLEKWHQQKIRLNQRETIPLFKENEIWWCNVGKNIGIEINGKGNLFLRPVLVFKKHSTLGFLGIPLTTAGTIDKDWYVDFDFQGKTSRAAIAQIRTFATERLFKRMGTIDDVDARRVYEGFIRFYQKNFPQPHK